MRTRRLFALLLIAVMVMGFVVSAKADEPVISTFKLNDTNDYTIAAGASKEIVFEVDLTGYGVGTKFVFESLDVGNNDIFTNVSNYQYCLNDLIYHELTNGQEFDASGQIWIKATVRTTKSAIDGTVPFVLQLKYEDAEGSPSSISKTCLVYTTIAPAYSGSSSESSAPVAATVTENPKLFISPVDGEGKRVDAPKGDYGDTLKVRVPLVCNFGANTEVGFSRFTSVKNIFLTPVLSANLDEFPFEINAVDYTLQYPNTLYDGDIMVFEYTLRLSKLVSAGTKKVDFKATYVNNYTGLTEETVVSVFVTVKKGAPVNAEGETTASAPKLIIESYTFSTDKVYAGETFDITFIVRNTSSSEDTKNIRVSMTDDSGTLLPGNNGSNTLYIDEIGRGETQTRTVSFQTSPSAEAKACTLTLDFSYEGSSTAVEHKLSETITVPVLQKIRIRCDEPTIYDEAWLDQSCSMYCALYNLGKASLYNCIVEVEGDGLQIEEPYFGGTISSGSKMSADFSVIPSVAGEIQGNVVITYEDVYGEQSVEKLPFTLFVNEEVPMDMGEMTFDEFGNPIPPDGMEGMGVVEEKTAMSLPLKLTLIVVGTLTVGGLIAAAIIILKRRRAKELSDI